MPIWLIEPHDSVIARDARPFSATAGARARSLPFVTPSMVAGTMRGRAGSNIHGSFVHPNPIDLLQISMRGPLLVELDAHDGIIDWWIPAPSDALLMNDDEHHNNDHFVLHRMQLLPELRHFSNMPIHAGQALTPVGLTTIEKRKPTHQAYWSWQHLFRPWLSHPQLQQTIKKSHVMANLPTDFRTHVAIDDDSKTVGDSGGRLFSTQGIVFRRGTLGAVRRFAVVVESDVEMQQSVPVMTMGGERRLVSWNLSSDSLPVLDAGLVNMIVQQQACRVYLLTPGYFTQGWCPDWLLQPRFGVTVQLESATAGRSQVISGWDLLRNQPKPSTRFAPAGSTYFLRFGGEIGNIPQWLASVWMQNISDDPQARRDGYGLAVVGVN
jgi:CRISPR-associated protein Cmr3